MKKTFLSIFFSGLFLYFLYYLIFPVYFGIANPKKYWKISNMPDFSFYQIENDTIPFYASDLNQNKHTIIIFFNTNCHFCQNELNAISLNLHKFKNTQFLLVAEQRNSAIKGYLQEISLYKRANVFVAQSKRLEFFHQFGSYPIPTIYIYKPNNQLRKRLIGEHSIDDLLTYVE